MHISTSIRGCVWLASLLLVPVAALTLACSGGGGSKESPTPVRIEASPNQAEVTAGRDLPLSYNLYGTVDRNVRWTVMEAAGGRISPAGVYTAPLQPGLYHVMVQPKVALVAMDTAEIKVHPRPVAHSLKADRQRLKPGEGVTLTAAFEGGRGVIEPGGTEIASGVPTVFTPGRST